MATRLPSATISCRTAMSRRWSSASWAPLPLRAAACATAPSRSRWRLSARWPWPPWPHARRRARGCRAPAGPPRRRASARPWKQGPAAASAKLWTRTPSWPSTWSCRRSGSSGRASRAHARAGSRTIARLIRCPTRTACGRTSTQRPTRSVRPATSSRRALCGARARHPTRLKERTTRVAVAPRFGTRSPAPTRSACRAQTAATAAIRHHARSTRPCSRRARLATWRPTPTICGRRTLRS
mmetsp:Transcript_92514/g.238832  ORF Transcript_92514/g.238832 Transcript_92514/m.238832 type:complete len:240 (+) Transcript_92514:67-786(+)